MATFVLVHGGYHGGWCWKRVVPFLRAAEHEVFAPTLSGLADRSHVLTRDVGLDTHFLDIDGLLKYEDLMGVILVGHGFGGMVITGVAARVPHRIRHLVYLDALAPQPGQSVMDILGPEASARVLDRAKSKGEGWKMLPPEGGPLFGVSDEGDLSWLRTKLTPQPLKSTQQPAVPKGNPLPNVSATFIACTSPQMPSMAPIAAQVRAAKTWRYRELPTGHDAMLTMPKELTSLLLEVA